MNVSATLKDVAARAEVSVTTASRVLNADPQLSVSPLTRQRVLNAAADLAYKGRRIKHYHDSHRLAVLQWYQHDQELDDVYYLNLRLQIEHAAQQAGWETTTAFANNWESLSTDIGSLIAIGKYSPQQLRELQDRFSRLVIVDCDSLESGIDCVLPDLAGGVQQSVNYLKQHYKQLGMIAGQENTTDGSSVANTRLAAFQAAVGPQQANHFSYGNYQVDGGYEAMRSLLRHYPHLQAVLIANDAMAMGALHYLHDCHFHIPGRIALMSCNDTVAAKYAYPPLSSISVPTAQMAADALKLLALRNKQPDAAATRMVVGTKLVIRQSTK